MTVSFETLREGDGKVRVHSLDMAYTPVTETYADKDFSARRPFWRYARNRLARHGTLNIPSLQDVVTVHYTTSLKDGRVVC